MNKVIGELRKGSAMIIFLEREETLENRGKWIVIDGKKHAFIPTSSFRCFLVKDVTDSCVGKAIGFTNG